MRASIPIVPQIEAQIDPALADRISGIAERLQADDRTLASTDMFAGHVASGLSDAPGLFIEDHSQMALFAAESDRAYEYRARLLAGDNDFVVIAGERYPEFEAYCRESLRLGDVEILQPAAFDRPGNFSIARRCAHDEALLGRVVTAARQHGEFNVVPYIGMGDAWRLAAAIARRAGTHVHVAAPPPRLTRAVNDKLWFAARVTELFDRTAIPVTFAAYGPAALAAKLRAVAARYGRVVVKVPDSSGSMGNLVFTSDDIRQTPLRQLRWRLVAALWGLGWRHTYPLLVSVWDAPVLESPSVHLWIPTAAEGAPIIEGVFTQAIAGMTGEFIGAEPANLPDDLIRRTAGEAMALGVLFQKLGYFGRCSFDAVLVGSTPEDSELHWIECNGRWGGVSTPMTLANRLMANWRRRPFVIVQRTHMTMPTRSFAAVRARLGPLLYRPDTGDTGIVVLTPGRLAKGTGLNFMALGHTLEHARKLAWDAASRLNRRTDQE